MSSLDEHEHEVNENFDVAFAKGTCVPASADSGVQAFLDALSLQDRAEVENALRAPRISDTTYMRAN